MYYNYLQIYVAEKKIKIQIQYILPNHLWVFLLWQKYWYRYSVSASTQIKVSVSYWFEKKWYWCIPSFNILM